MSMKPNLKKGPFGCAFNSKQKAQGFTLVEMMVSMSLLMVLMMVIFSAISLASNTNKRVSADVVSFFDASTAFANMTRKLSMATLNTYLDYYPDQTGENPDPPETYIRKSQLHFVISRVGGNGSDALPEGNADENPTFGVFFQAPLGYTNPDENSSNFRRLTNLLNSCGYYIQFGDDQPYMPQEILRLLPNARDRRRYRYRLMEFLQPSENLSVYATATSVEFPKSPSEFFDWYKNPIRTNNDNINSDMGRVVHPIADNIIALILVPKIASIDSQDNNAQTISNNYTYNSRINDGEGLQGDPPQQPVQQHQLPPLLRVTMVAIDEPSARLLQEQYKTSPPPLVSDQFFRNYDSRNERQTYERDLEQLAESLAEVRPRIKFRIFTTDVALRGAKWNTEDN
jgi:uncharacterized protein (TIGR02599 family)